MKTPKKSFVFNLEWAELLSDYPAEVRYEVYDAIIGYAASGTLSEMKPLAGMAFRFIKKEMDFNKKKLDQQRRFDIPNATKDLQRLKGAQI